MTVAVEIQLDLAAARAGNQQAFGRLTGRYRDELVRHCYRMLGSLHDAEDAVQEALFGAWRGLDSFEGRASVRTWLYRIATHACLAQIRRHGPRLLSSDHRPPTLETEDLGVPQPDERYVEPLPGPADRYESRESVELAYVAALQHLPGTQRAILLLREVLQFSAAEVAEQLDTTVAAVNSGLQRARRTLSERGPQRSQVAVRAEFGEDRIRSLVGDFVDAWERADIEALLALLTADARLTMPPLPVWYVGTGVRLFLERRVFSTRWRLTPTEINGQPGFVAFQEDHDGWRISSVMVLSISTGGVAAIDTFVDPAMFAGFELPPVPDAGRGAIDSRNFRADR